MTELQNQIEGMTENIVSDFLDVWQCQDWGVSCNKFVKLFIANISKSLKQVAREITEENEN